MTISTSDYAERLTEWNTDGQTAVSLLDSMLRSEDDRDLLAVDWRIDHDIEQAAILINRLGLEYSSSGLPIYQGCLINVHKTHKDKIFFDFVTELGTNLTVIERRIYLPIEDMVVASLFRATRERMPTRAD
jgi:hypothetical protein